MADAPLMNDDAARSTTGEILDQSQTQPTEVKTEPTTTETKPEPTTESKDGTTVLTKPEDKPADKPMVPEKYEDFKAPDGYQIDKAFVESALPVFKELGLTQDQAQKLVDIQVQRELVLAKGPQETYERTRQEWQTKTLNDADIKKAGIDTVKADIGRALNALGDNALTAEFKQAMDLTGAGDHPAFVKAFWKLSQFITEGKHVTGGGPSPAGQKGPGDKPASLAKALYPNLPG